MSPFRPPPARQPARVKAFGEDRLDRVAAQGRLDGGVGAPKASALGEQTEKPARRRIVEESFRKIMGRRDPRMLDAILNPATSSR